MNKKLVIGVIVVIAVAIGVSTIMLYADNLTTKKGEDINTSEGNVTTGRHLTIELNETMSLQENP